MPRHIGHALPREGKMKLRPVVCQGTQAMLYHEKVRGLGVDNSLGIYTYNNSITG